MHLRPWAVPAPYHLPFPPQCLETLRPLPYFHCYNARFHSQKWLFLDDTFCGHPTHCTQFSAASKRVAGFFWKLSFAGGGHLV